MPPLLQRVMEHRQRSRLSDRLKVDQQIPAGDEVQIGEGRVIQDIVWREDDRLAYLGRHLVVILAFDEELLQSFFAHSLQHISGVDTTAGVLER